MSQSDLPLSNEGSRHTVSAQPQEGNNPSTPALGQPPVNPTDMPSGTPPTNPDDSEACSEDQLGDMDCLLCLIPLYIIMAALLFIVLIEALLSLIEPVCLYFGEHNWLYLTPVMMYLFLSFPFMLLSIGIDVRV